jgi:transcriptional regulator with XRE-family HTH domain
MGDAGLSQGELARRLKVSTQAVNRDEAGGYRRASLERLARVAKVLGLQAEISCQRSNAK